LLIDLFKFFNLLSGLLIEPIFSFFFVSKNSDQKYKVPFERFIKIAEGFISLENIQTIKDQRSNCRNSKEDEERRSLD
jgi:hypothetical protein